MDSPERTNAPEAIDLTPEMRKGVMLKLYRLGAASLHILPSRFEIKARGTNLCHGQRRRWACTFSTRPRPIRLVSIEDPPKEINGRGMPVTGIMPMFIPTAWNA